MLKTFWRHLSDTALTTVILDIQDTFATIATIDICYPRRCGHTGIEIILQSCM